MKKLFFLLMVIFAGWKFNSSSGQVSLGHSILAGEVPYQENFSSSANLKFGDYTITKFSIKAKVLSNKKIITLVEKRTYVQLI